MSGAKEKGPDQETFPGQKPHQQRLDRELGSCHTDSVQRPSASSLQHICSGPCGTQDTASRRPSSPLAASSSGVYHCLTARYEFTHGQLPAAQTAGGDSARGAPWRDSGKAREESHVRVKK